MRTLKPPGYWRAAYLRYREGDSFKLRAQLMGQRAAVSQRFKAAFNPIRSLTQTGAILGVSKQAVAQAENEIFWKIFTRMKDPHFKI